MCSFSNWSIWFKVSIRSVDTNCIEKSWIEFCTVISLYILTSPLTGWIELYENAGMISVTGLKSIVDLWSAMEYNGWKTLEIKCLPLHSRLFLQFPDNNCRISQLHMCHYQLSETRHEYGLSPNFENYFSSCSKGRHPYEQH